MPQGQKRPFSRRVAYANASEYIAELARDDTDNELELGSIAREEHSVRVSVTSKDTIDLGVNRDAKVSPGSPNCDNESFRNSKHTLSVLSTFKPAYEFGWLDFLLTAAAILFFYVDLGTDINLTIKYFLNREWEHGGVTLALTAGPSVITCALGIHWYILDYQIEKKMLTSSTFSQEKKNFYKTQTTLWVLRFVMTILQMGPVIRYLEYIWYGWHSRVEKQEKFKRRYHRLMLYEDVDAALLRLFEAFLEAAPQLTYQLYIWISVRPEENAIELSARLGATASSWLGLAIALASYHRSLRFSCADKDDMNFCSMLSYLTWRAFEVGGRVLCIAMFASAFNYWVFLPCLLHWAMASLWLMCQRTAFYEHTLLEKAFNVICGYVMIFCYLNMREGYTRWRYLTFYIVFYVENGAMVFAWLFFSPKGNPWYHLYGSIIVFTAAGAHILLQLFYYKLCHPTGRIRWCLPCITCHESVCSDMAEEPAHLHTKPHTMKDVYRSQNDQDSEFSGKVVDL